MIVFFRSLLFNIFFYFWTALVMVEFLPLIFFPPVVVINAGRLWARGIVFAAKIICGIKWQVKGAENIPEGAAVIASKHQSAWETIVFYILCSMPVYILKKELQYIPVFGWYIKAIRAIAVNRSGGAAALRKMVKQVQERRKEGRQIIVFPEGTRVSPGKKRKYQAGIAAIYAHTNMPVIPVALNSGKCWPKNSFMKYPGTITFEILRPIEPGMPKKEFMKQLEDKIETASASL